MTGEVVETFAEFVAVNLGGTEPAILLQAEVRRVG